MLFELYLFATLWSIPIIGTLTGTVVAIFIMRRTPTRPERGPSKAQWAKLAASGVFVSLLGVLGAWITADKPLEDPPEMRRDNW